VGERDAERIGKGGNRMTSRQDTNEPPGNRPLTEAMAVFDADGERVGTLRSPETHNGLLRIHRSRLFGHDFSLSWNLVARVDAGGINLSIRKKEVEAYARASMLHTAPGRSAPGMGTIEGPVSPASPGGVPPDDPHRTARIAPTAETTSRRRQSDR
jgi:hypothetical protein